MTLFFPDINLWLAASDGAHAHYEAAGRWINALPPVSRLLFSRYTQLGLLRLLTNETVMGGYAVSLGKAWDIYDQWLADDRVEFYPEPPGCDRAFRETTRHLHARSASKAIGDCYLIAFAQESGAALVTFDRALAAHAKKFGCRTTTPA